MFSLKKKVFGEFILAVLLMLVVLPLSSQAALITKSKAGYTNYAGYWKSEADTVAPDSYIMDYNQYGGQNTVASTLSTGQVEFGSLTIKGKTWYPITVAGSDIYIAPASEGPISLVLLGSHVVNLSTATVQTYAIPGNTVIYYILKPFSTIAKYGVLGFLVLGLIWGLLTDSVPAFSLGWGSVLSAALGAVFLGAFYFFIDLVSQMFLDAAVNAVPSYSSVIFTVVWAALWILFWVIIIRMVAYGVSILRNTVKNPWPWVIASIIVYLYYPAAAAVLIALAALGSTQWFSNFLENQVSFGR